MNVPHDGPDKLQKVAHFYFVIKMLFDGALHLYFICSKHKGMILNKQGQRV
jgi:hypothetical protein